MNRHRSFRLRISDDQCYCIWLNSLGVLLGKFQLHISSCLIEPIRGTDGCRNGLCPIAHLQAHLWRYQFKQATGFAYNLNRVEACANLLAARHEAPTYLASHPCLNSLWREYDNGDKEFLRRHAAMKIGFCSAFHLKTGKVPGNSDFQVST